jgi:hypothetical protein
LFSVYSSSEFLIQLRYYRSYKTFDIENFNDDIEQIKINQTCHEVDSVYNEYEKDLINVLNKIHFSCTVELVKHFTMFKVYTLSLTVGGVCDDTHYFYPTTTVTNTGYKWLLFV